MANETSKTLFRTIQFKDHDSIKILSVHASEQNMTLKKYIEKMVKDKVVSIKRQNSKNAVVNTQN